MRKYKVYDLEVAKKDGLEYTVYNETFSGTVELDDELTDDDIVRSLTKAMYFDFEPFSPASVAVDGDEDQIFINYNNQPYLQLKKD